MATKTTNQISPLSSIVVEIDGANSTPQVNLTGGSGKFFIIDIDNSLVAANTYVKVYDSSNPTVGTTDPDWIFVASANKRVVYSILAGASFSTALSVAAVTTGGTSGTTSPSDNCKVYISTT